MSNIHDIRAISGLPPLPAPTGSVRVKDIAHQTRGDLNAKTWDLKHDQKPLQSLAFAAKFLCEWTRHNEYPEKMTGEFLHFTELIDQLDTEVRRVFTINDQLRSYLDDPSKMPQMPPSAPPVDNAHVAEGCEKFGEDVQLPASCTTGEMKRRNLLAKIDELEIRLEGRGDAIKALQNQLAATEHQLAVTERGVQELNKRIAAREELIAEAISIINKLMIGWAVSRNDHDGYDIMETRVDQLKANLQLERTL